MFVVLTCCAGEDVEPPGAFLKVFLLPVFIKEDIETAECSDAHFQSQYPGCWVSVSSKPT